MNIVCICYKNRGRSPLLEAALKKEARERNLPLSVSSRGISPSDDYGWIPGFWYIGVCFKFGLDISGHVSRRVAKSDIDTSDLVLAIDDEVSGELIRQFGNSLKLKRAREFVSSKSLLTTGNLEDNSVMPDKQFRKVHSNTVRAYYLQIYEMKRLARHVCDQIFTQNDGKY